MHTQGGSLHWRPKRQQGQAPSSAQPDPAAWDLGSGLGAKNSEDVGKKEAKEMVEEGRRSPGPPGDLVTTSSRT